MNNLISSVTDKFRFVDTVKNTIEEYKVMFSSVETLPKMYINLPENKWLSGEILLIDLAWYAPFKQYGDLIISAFIYVFFVWRIFIKLPNIIGGFGGQIEMIDSAKYFKDVIKK